MFSDYFTLAIKSLRRRALRSFLTILGIVIGIAAVVSLISLGEGLREAITGQFSSLGTDTLVIQSVGTGFGPPGSTAANPLTEKDIRIIEGVPGVSLVIPRLIRIAKIEVDKEVFFNGINSLPSDQEQLEFVYESMNLEIESGRLLEGNDRGKIIVGNGFANKEEFNGRIRVGSDLIIQGDDFEIAGILKKSGSVFINEDISVPEEDIKDILDIEEDVDLIVVKIDDKSNIEIVSERISRALRNERNQKLGEEDFSVQTPLQSVEAFNTILSIINIIFFGIAAISLLVGGIGIANTMYTSVLERTKDIGIMKAIGARNRDVLMIFILESGILGLIGGAIGVLFGALLAIGITQAVGSFLGGLVLEAQISWSLVLASVGFSFIIGLVAGILPAFQASKLKPVEALRK